MRCQKCGYLIEPGDSFCTGCGAKIESYYTEDPGGYSEPVYNNNPGYNEAYASTPVQRNGNNTALYVVLAVLATVLVGLVAWLLINHFQEKAEPQNTTTYVEVQTTPPAETVYVTAAPAKTSTPVVKTGGYLLPESNSRRMTDADLSQLTHEELCFARNEIYARYGRIFDTPQVANYFESKSWYSGTIPANKFNENVLTSTERANVDIIFAYEKQHYGGSYY